MLIVRDAVLAIWGAEDKLGPRVPGLRRRARDRRAIAIPEYDLFLIVVGPLVLAALTWLVTPHAVRRADPRRLGESRDGGRARHASRRCSTPPCSRSGRSSPALAGALQLPREPANLGMDLAVVAEAFVVTVVGGLGSIPGAFVAALIIGLTKALCIALGTVEIAGLDIAFPKLTLVAEFIVMAIVLAVKPHGLLGQARDRTANDAVAGAARARHRPRPTRRQVRARPARRPALLLPLLRDDYALVLATDMLIAALFAASLQFLMGPGGMACFGHAAYFGVGAYAAALAVQAWLADAGRAGCSPDCRGRGGVDARLASAFGWRASTSRCSRSRSRRSSGRSRSSGTR